MPQSLMPKKLKLSSSMKRMMPSRVNTKTQKQKVLFIIGDWNAKVGIQEIPRITGKNSLGIQNEEG